MIPVLYESNEITFADNGIGRLSDVISCQVLEERNGEFETEFQYPITGIHYDDITEGRIIYVDHDEQKDPQPFIIYRRSAPINGVVTFNAHHVSYLLSSVIIEPFTASSVSDAFNTFTTDNMNTNPFTFWTDNTTGGSMTSEVPASVRALMGGNKGSILDVFGGEYKYDKFLVRNYASRGSDNGVTIRYGKNLSDIVWEVDTMDLYGSVVPYWSDGESTVVYGGIVSGGGAVNRVTTLDLSQEFDAQPTVAQLETRAAQFLSANEPWIPKENIKIDFIPLWQTEEYADVAPLERVCLCDTVTVIYTDLGVTATAKVIKVVWDALLEKYTSIELGQAKSSFADTIIGEVDTKLSEAIANVPTTSAVQAAIDNATSLITGGMGGNICFLYDANGKPTDMLVMDTDNVSTAVHVLRINVNGIGFSSTGVSGTYTSAWTLDGAFVADFITSGYLSANRIQGGTLTMGGNNNGNGVIVVYNSSGTEIGRWDKDGLKQIASNVYTYIGTASHPYFNPNAGTITRTDRTGFLTTYNDSSTNNVYAVAPTNGTMYSTTAADTEIRTINVSGSTAGTGQSFSTQEIIAKGYYRKDYWERNNSTSTYNGYATVVIRPKQHFGIGMPNSATLPTIGSGNTPYAFLDEPNQVIDAKAGGAWLHLYGNNATVDIKNSATIKTNTGTTFGFSSTDFSYNASTYPQLQITGSAFRAFLTSSIYLWYSGSYWSIKGTNQSGNIAIQGSSSKRYKHDITDQIDEELDAHRLYALTMKQFVFNDDCESWEYPDLKGKTLPGFIAEDVEEIYPAAAIHDHEGTIQNWDVRRIVPGMLKLIQEQHEEIEDLKARLAKLEQIVEALTL